jgi:hypothetical protein
MSDEEDDGAEPPPKRACGGFVRASQLLAGPAPKPEAPNPRALPPDVKGQQVCLILADACIIIIVTVIGTPWSHFNRMFFFPPLSHPPEPTAAPAQQSPPAKRKLPACLAMSAAPPRLEGASPGCQVCLDAGLGGIARLEQQRKLLAMAVARQTSACWGCAGTGKLRRRDMVSALRREPGMRDAVVVTALTGIAALNVGGCTLHSWAAWDWPSRSRRICWESC